MPEELSQKIVVVLLVLTILISIVGTWTVMVSSEEPAAPEPAQTNPGKGQIVLKIMPQPDEGGVSDGQ